MGMAFQHGALPLSSEALEQAIRLNNVNVEQNLLAFRLGRWYAHEPEHFSNWVKAPQAQQPLTAFTDILNDREQRLNAYQNTALAKQYRDTVVALHKRELAVMGSEDLSILIAKNLFKLMAILYITPSSSHANS